MCEMLSPVALHDSISWRPWQRRTGDRSAASRTRVAQQSSLVGGGYAPCHAEASMRSSSSAPVTIIVRSNLYATTPAAVP